MNYWDFTSGSNWFSARLPEHWSEYEDDEGTYAFFNTIKWSGNLRITPYRWEGNPNKAASYIADELNDNPNAVSMKIGTWDAAFYSKEASDDSLIYFWVTGIKNYIFLCSFTVNKEFLGTKDHDLELFLVEDILRSITINEGLTAMGSINVLE